MEPETSDILAYGGLITGLIFGVLAQRSRFCLVAATSNFMLMRDTRQLDAYLAALAVAIGGTAILEASSLVAIADSSFRGASINWFPPLLGGLMFGIGAMLAGGCASRTLVRCGEGNIAAILTLLAFSLSGMAALFGFLEPVRGSVSALAVIPLAEGDNSLAQLLSAPQWLPATLLILAFLGLIGWHGRTRRNRQPVIYGALIGALVVLGWWITGVSAYDEFEAAPPSTLSVAGPLARDVIYLTTLQASGNLFALMLVPGILLGSLFSALLSGDFHWTPPAGERVGVYLVGGLFMGIGAVLAGGCNIGQGLGGMSTLSAQSLIAVNGIFLGMIVTVIYLQGRE